MIPYDLDPSLHTGEPEAQTLDDGFSPPQHDANTREGESQTVAPPRVALPEKSAF
jgi:hypothetical protein